MKKKDDDIFTLTRRGVYVNEHFHI